MGREKITVIRHTQLVNQQTKDISQGTCCTLQVFESPRTASRPPGGGVMVRMSDLGDPGSNPDSVL